MKLLNNLLIILFITTYIFAKSDVNLNEEEKKYLEEHTPLLLHNEINWPPYNFYEKGKPKGFSIDYMNLLAKKLNIEVRYVTGPSWDQFMQMLQEGEIDAIINISKNQERAKSIAFTSIFHTAANAIYVKEGNEHIDSLEKLKHKTIVMPKGFFAQKAISKNYPDIKQILVKDTLEALKLLSLGKADATVGKKNVIDYVIALNNISGVIPTNYVDDNRMVSLIRIGVAKKNTLLRDILQKAQKDVSDQELLTLKRKWFGVKDIKPKGKTNFLTEKEENYIANRKIFRVCHRNDLKPIEFEENGIYQGITIDLLKKIEKLTNARFIPIKTSSWEEAKEFLKKKKCDFIPTVTNSSEIIDFAKTSKTYLNYKLAIITQKDKPVVSSLESILDKTMAKIKDSSLIPLLKSTNPDLEVIPTNSNREALEAVSSGKAYFALEPLPIASYYMSNFALNNLYISRYTNMPFTVNMAVAKDNPLLLNILNKALSMISQTEQREIFNKWTATFSYEKITDFKYFWEIVICFLALVIIFAYRHYALGRLNTNLKLAKNEIEKKTNQLEKQKLLFETLYNKSADGVILIKNNQIISCNEAALKIFNFKKDQFLSYTLLDFSATFEGVDSKKELQEYIDMALNEGVKIFEWIFKDSKKNNIWTEVVLTAIEIEDNKVLHAVIRDINSRKNLEQKLEDLNSNLEKKVKEEIRKNEINTQQLIQQSRLAQMGEMISMIAHQWRQPLSAISATTNNLILKMMISDEVDKKFFDNELNLITEYSQHLSSTIDDFRNFFKKEKEKKEFDLNITIKKSIYIIKTSLESKNISLKMDFDDNIIIYSYPTELQQVILNILKNSEDALIEKKKLEKKIFIKTYKIDKYIAIDISDNAGGIEENILEKIFDPYFSTKNKKDGTGLGLYMSKIIINEHCNGKLQVSNEKDGAKFTILLPLNEGKESVK